MNFKSITHCKGDAFVTLCNLQNNACSSITTDKTRVDCTACLEYLKANREELQRLYEARKLEKESLGARLNQARELEDFDSSHYKNHPSGIECIEVAQHFNFNLGNVIKYVWKAGNKNGNPAVQDLQKARKYLEFEIERIKNGTVEKRGSSST